MTRPEVHRQVHGLERPQEAYERLETWFVAVTVFERCAQKGFVEIVPMWSRDISENVLQSCMKCIHDKDRYFLACVL